MKDRIKQLRKHLKLTQALFGEKIGLKATAIGMYESGDRNISEQTILSICREFNVNEQWLRNGTGEMFLEQSRDEEIAEFIGKAQFENGFKSRFISILSKLNESDWEVLEKMILLLSEEKNKG